MEYVELYDKYLKNIFCSKMDELSKINSELLLAEAIEEKGISGELPFTLEAKREEYNRVEAELVSMGMKKLNNNEVKTLLENEGKYSINAIPEFPEVPDSTSSNTWYSKGPSRTYDSKTKQYYNVYSIYAVPKNLTSSMADRVDFDMWYKQDNAERLLNKLISIYAQKIVATVRAISWYPWELLWPDGGQPESLSGSDYNIYGSAATTVCFAFVKPEKKEDTYYHLTLTSHSLSLAVLHNLRGVGKNGEAIAVSIPTNDTIQSSYWESVIRARQFYIESQTAGHVVSAIPTLKYYSGTHSDPDQDIIKEYYPPMASFMADVY